jgi:hypothetical protein
MAAQSDQAFTQRVQGGGVTVAVTWMKEGGPDPAFKVVLDTHSVKLDGYQWEKIVSLRGRDGATVSPAAAEQASGSGHHREAILRFPAGSADGAIEVVVAGVAGVQERLFRWPAQP